jgi:hypothetical protein
MSMCFQSFIFPFGTYLPRTPRVMIPKLSTCSRIFCQCQSNIHVDLVWQLWMGGGGGLMVHLASDCGFNSVFVTWVKKC